MRKEVIGGSGFNIQLTSPQRIANSSFTGPSGGHQAGAPRPEKRRNAVMRRLNVNLAAEEIVVAQHKKGKWRVDEVEA
jgi:hypothetical protein